MDALKIREDGLRVLFERLNNRGRVIGPRLLDGVVILADIDYPDIPAGYRDIQGPASYRTEKGADRIFSFSLGPQSFKTFLNPPAQQLLAFRTSRKGISVERHPAETGPLSFFGVRACDLAALKLLDKVFIEGPVPDSGYQFRRRDLIIVAVNCLSPGANCFCASMGSGPEATSGFDIALTEMKGFFLVEAATGAGEVLAAGLPHEKASEQDIAEKQSCISGCRAAMKKSLKTGDLPEVLYRNMEHSRWEEIAKRDLACGNCTMVCPTCFCNSSFDRISPRMISGNLKEFSGVRERTWDSCFSRNFARVHGGNFRPSRKARYRHWMMHKLAYWIDQFGSPGCVGCGRCITWCPVGIDLTHELEELRRAR